MKLIESFVSTPSPGKLPHLLKSPIYGITGFSESGQDVGMSLPRNSVRRRDIATSAF